MANLPKDRQGKQQQYLAMRGGTLTGTPGSPEPQPPSSSQSGHTTRSTSVRTRSEPQETHAASQNAVTGHVDTLYRKGLIQSKTVPGFSDLVGALEIMAANSKYVSSETGKAVEAVAALLRVVQEERMATSIAQKVSAKIEGSFERLEALIGLGERMDTYSENVEASVIGALNRCERGFEAVNETLQEIGTKIEKNAASPTQQEPPRSYAQAAATRTSPSLPRIDETRMRAQNEIHRRQVKFTLADNTAGTELATKSVKDVVEVLNRSLEDINAPPEVRFVAARWGKGPRSVLLTEMTSPTAAEWMKAIEHDTSFHAKMEGALHLAQQMFSVLVKFAPVEFETNEDENLRRLEQDNNLPTGAIARGRWCKNPRHRKPDQRRAHLLLSLTSAESANSLLVRGVLFGCLHIRCSGEKPAPEEIRCYHCQGLGHIAVSCPKKGSPDTNLVCGRCGGGHDAAGCESEQVKCVNCHSTSHTSRDRTCPELIRRNELIGARRPEALLPYYPTGDEWTWSTLPSNAPRSDLGREQITERAQGLQQLTIMEAFNAGQKDATGAETQTDGTLHGWD